MNELLIEAGEPEEHIKAEIARMVAEMQRLHEQIQRDQARVESLKQETDATMTRAHEALAKLQIGCFADNGAGWLDLHPECGHRRPPR